MAYDSPSEHCSDSLISKTTTTSSLSNIFLRVDGFIDNTQPTDDIITQATCVTSIAEHFDFALPTISRHLKELKDAKIITMTKHKNKIYIESNIETMKEIAGCFDILVSDYEKGTLYSRI